MRLDDILNLLCSPRGSALVDGVYDRLARLGFDPNRLDIGSNKSFFDAMLKAARTHDIPVDPAIRERLASFKQINLGETDAFERRKFKFPAPMPQAPWDRALVLHTYLTLSATVTVGAELTRRMLPQAIVSALGEACGPDGLLTREACARVFGEEASRFLAQVDRAGPPPPRVENAGLLKYRSLLHWGSCIRKLGASQRQAVDPKRAPALQRVLDTLGGARPLAGFRLLAIQHLLPTTRLLFEALAKAGADPARTTVVGKSYSTDPDTFARLLADKWDVDSSEALLGISMKPGEPFERIDELPEELRWPNGDEQSAAAFRQLKRLFASLPPGSEEKIMLLDDGGRLVDILHRFFPEHVARCVAIEQTDHGIQVLEKMQRDGRKLGCPVINVARSQAKKLFESAMIGESVAFSTEQYLAQIGDLRIEPKEATIIGYGAVGKATADALRRRGYLVRVHDTDPAKLALARQEGCVPVDRAEALEKGRLLISCTGRRTMELEDYERLPNGAVLVNAASGNHELSADKLDEQEDDNRSRGGLDDLLALGRPRRPRYGDPLEAWDGNDVRRTSFQGKSIDLGHRLDGNTGHRVVRTPGGKEMLLVRSGFVVNLAQDIPPEFIQLTRALLLAACIQASKGGSAGLHELDPAMQQLIVDTAREHLRSMGKSLEQPDFR